MKVAILCKGSLDNMKGVMNYVNEKAKRMSSFYCNGCVEVETFLLETEWTWLFNVLVNHRFVLPSNPHNGDTRIQDDVKYQYISYRYSVYDSIVTSKRLGKPISDSEVNSLAQYLKEYDVIASHNPICHYLALKIKEKYGIPVVLTWHGSDINIFPFSAPWKYNLIKSEIESADMNFFVSKALMHNSNRITEKGKKEHIYTGPASIFKRLSEEEKKACRKKYANNRKYVIGYVGNIVDVKNVMVLPRIFHQIVQLIPSSEVLFVVAGDGLLVPSLQNELNKLQIQVKFLGRVPPAEIPFVMNALDVLVLPSKNEGLGLVALEARTCGANVVGSQVDGIPEAIAQPKNCFSLDDNFTDRISKRIVEILLNAEKPQPLSKGFSWESAIEKELSLYKSLIKQYEEEHS